MVLNVHRAGWALVAAGCAPLPRTPLSAPWSLTADGALTVAEVRVTALTLHEPPGASFPVPPEEGLAGRGEVVGAWVGGVVVDLLARPVPAVGQLDGYAGPVATARWTLSGDGESVAAATFAWDAVSLSLDEAVTVVVPTEVDLDAAGLALRLDGDVVLETLTDALGAWPWVGVDAVRQQDALRGALRDADAWSVVEGAP